MGFGTKTITALKNMLTKTFIKVKSIKLSVDIDNAAAKKVYDKSGFKTDAYHMTLLLK
jgi:RimJ/RimL family protein N-acetyltransferase